MYKRISDLSNLIFEVYVIGYSERGESILILFIDKGEENRIIYSIVIDSFKFKGVHKTIEIMDKYNLKKQKLDMLVWSHPDYDHTFGLNEIINYYCGENTQVVLPYDLNGNAWDKINYNREDKDHINKILDLTKRKFKSHDTALSSDNLYHPHVEISLEDSLRKLPISILSLSPHSTRINYMLETNSIIHKNDLSITLMIGIGKDYANKFLFFSDIENSDIDSLYQKAFDNPQFVKIPHHGSSTSNVLPTRFDVTSSKLPIACTTIYKSHNLPDVDVLKEYCARFEQVDCTGRSKSKKVNFGYVQYTFDLFDKQIVTIGHCGHAEIVDDAYLNSLIKLIPQKK